MIIVSQDKTRTVNFDNITDIFIGFANENRDRSIRCEKVNKEYVELGIYKTEERAKEVLEEIVKEYKVTEAFKACANRIMDKIGAKVIEEGFAYKMPLE